jgi:cytidyltransferase-like protein
MDERGKTVIALSGYFNPLHVGHLEMIQHARELADEVVVIVNNDLQVQLKGSVPFMPLNERIEILAALRDVDRVVVSIDTDKTVCKTLEILRPDVFGNGGDRPDKGSIPETEVCERLGIELVFGLGDKIQSSSTLIANAKKFNDTRVGV